MINLPQTLQAFLVIFENPVIMAVAISMLIEQWSWIQNPAVSNLAKIGFTLLVGYVWAVIVTLLTTGTPNSPDSWYSLIVLAVGFTMSMNIWNKLVNQAIPWLQDFLLALFGRISPSNSPALNRVNKITKQAWYSHNG
jgi:hypothetical protein